MSITLKDINRPGLVLVVVANLAGYYALMVNDLSTISTITQEYERYIPAALLALVAGLLNSQFDHTQKARLVFWRWNNPLPGCRAFTSIMMSDDRIDQSALLSIKNPLPKEPAEQNRLWFKWYRELQDEPGIKQAHREYLFARDWACIVVLLGIVLIPAALLQMGAGRAVVLTIALGIEYMLVRRSASNHGTRFVASVLAYKGSGK